MFDSPGARTQKPPLTSWLLHPSDQFLATTAPRRENPIFSLLVRRWKQHLHRMPDPILWGSVALAILSAALVPLQAFSFFVWHAIFFVHVLWPALIFPAELRRGGALADDLLLSPLHPGRYVQALRSIFFLSVLYAAVPYVTYWLALFGLKAFLAPALFSAWPTATVLTGAVLYFVALSSLLWFALWCAAAGGGWLLLPALITPAAFLLYAADFERLVGIEPFPVTPGYWLAAFNLFLFGYLLAVALARRRENPFLRR